MNIKFNLTADKKPPKTNSKTDIIGIFKDNEGNLDIFSCYHYEPNEFNDIVWWLNIDDEIYFETEPIAWIEYDKFDEAVLKGLRNEL